MGLMLFEGLWRTKMPRRAWRGFAAGVAGTVELVAGAQTNCKECCCCCCCDGSCSWTECSCSWHGTCKWAGWDNVGASNKGGVVVADAAYSSTFCTCHACESCREGYCSSDTGAVVVSYC